MEIKARLIVEYPHVGGVFIANLNDVCVDYDIKPPINEKLIEKIQCIHTNYMLNYGVMYSD